MSREELLTYRKKDKSNRVTLVLRFLHKIRGIQQFLQKSYKIITCNPDLKQIFPDPPMISFRRAPNIRGKVMQANHQDTTDVSPYYLQKENLILLISLTTPRQLQRPSVTKPVIQEAMSIPLEQFPLLYVQNIRNFMLDKQDSTRFNSHKQDSTATAQMQFTTLTDPIQHKTTI